MKKAERAWEVYVGILTRSVIVFVIMLPLLLLAILISIRILWISIVLVPLTAWWINWKLPS